MQLVLADIEGDALAAAAAALPAPAAEVVTVVADVSKAEQVEALRRSALERLRRRPPGVQQRRRGRPAVRSSRSRSTTGSGCSGSTSGASSTACAPSCPLLQEQGEGHIVNTASVAGLFAAPYMGPYNVSKYGVVALSETLYNELAIAAVGRGRVGAVPVVGADPHRRVRPQPARRARATPTRPPPSPRSSTASSPPASSRPRWPPAVAEAVKVRRFWILTHDDTRAAVKARTASILDDGTPPLLMH